MPLVSVVMPVYNGAKYLELSLSSVLKQTYPNIEVIVVDDGSTDNSLELCKRFVDHRIKVFRIANGGVGAARNFGISKATGSLIACLDADDMWASSKISKQVQRFDSNQKLVLVGTYCLVIDVWGKEVYNYTAIPKEDLAIRSYLRIGNPFVTSSVMFTAVAARKAGGFYDTTRVISEDFPFWTKLSSLGEVQNISECLTLYRVVPGSLSRGVSGSEISSIILKLGRTSALTTAESDRLCFLVQQSKKESDLEATYYANIARLALIHGGRSEIVLAHLRAAWSIGDRRLKLLFYLFGASLPSTIRRWVRDFGLYLRRGVFRGR